MEKGDPQYFMAVPAPPGQKKSNRVNQSIKVEVDLDEKGKPDVDLEKGLQSHVESSSRSSNGKTRPHGKTERASIYSIKRNPGTGGEEAIELVSRGAAGEVEPNHKWLFVGFP